MERPGSGCVLYNAVKKREITCPERWEKRWVPTDVIDDKNVYENWFGLRGKFLLGGGYFGGGAT